MRRLTKVMMMIGTGIAMAAFGTGLAGAAEPVKVAILDSGSNSAYKEGISLIDGSVKDLNGHGTLIAGIVKEADPEAELYIVKVINASGTLVNEDVLIRGIEWAMSRGVKVINMSLKVKPSERLYEVIREAREKGVILVAAAGNQDSRSAKLGGGSSLAYPAAYSEVISVGAKDRSGKVYSQSTGCAEVDVFFKGYKSGKAGTSIASAYAAGTAARLLSENPAQNKAELVSLLNQMS